MRNGNVGDEGEEKDGMSSEVTEDAAGGNPRPLNTNQKSPRDQTPFHPVVKWTKNLVTRVSPRKLRHGQGHSDANY